MIKALALGLIAGTLAAPAFAQTLDPLAGNYWTRGGTVVISCFRGPIRETVWDHPRAVFIESLVAVGYDYPSAQAIAQRICRDVTLVGDEAGLIAAMEQIIAEAPGR